MSGNEIKQMSDDDWAEHIAILSNIRQQEAKEKAFKI